MTISDVAYRGYLNQPDETGVVPEQFCTSRAKWKYKVNTAKLKGHAEVVRCSGFAYLVIREDTRIVESIAYTHDVIAGKEGRYED